MTDTYRLNFNTQLVRPNVYVSQYDDGLRIIEFELYNNEEPYEPSEAEIRIGDETITPTIDGNKVSFPVTLSLSQNYGEYEGEVRCRMGTQNFNFIVDKTE